MAERAGFCQYVVDDLLSFLDGITSRFMFGGYGIYQDGVIFGLIADDKLYFKVDDTNRQQYEALGSQPFVYSQGKVKSTTMSYWEVPDSILDDRDQLREWVEISRGISEKKRI